jgi:hypothetical protein
MALAKKYEGTSTELAEELLALPGSQTYRMTLTLEVPVEEEAESLEAAIARITNRTPTEIASSRERMTTGCVPLLNNSLHRHIEHVDALPPPFTAQSEPPYTNAPSTQPQTSRP